MSKNYLILLESPCKKFVKDIAKGRDVVDVVLYGSAAKGKEEARDVDVLIIFSGKSLKERQNLVQDFKLEVRKIVENVDVKSINLAELFDAAFLARQNILIEGVSILDKKPLAEKLGFKGFALFTYALVNLSHNKKTRFNYAISGRSSLGVLKSLEGKSLGRGAVIVPIQHSYEFEQFLKEWGVVYKMKYALLPFY